MFFVRDFLFSAHETKKTGNTLERKGGEVLDSFSLKTRILSGPGSISFLETLKAKKVFLVTDPYFVKSGMAETILKATGAEKTAVF